MIESYVEIFRRQTYIAVLCSE